MSKNSKFVDTVQLYPEGTNGVYGDSLHKVTPKVNGTAS